MRVRGKWICSALCVAVTLGSPLCTFAQEEIKNSDVLQSYKLEDVLVVGERSAIMPAYPGGQVAVGGNVGIFGNKHFLDTPFTINSYTDTLMKNQLSQTVAEVVKNDPSVRFQYPSDVLMDNYRIRNFTYNANNMTMNGFMGMAPYASAPTEMFERVEVMRGPNAFANGINPGGEIAGAINLVTKEARNEPIRQATLDYSYSGRVGGAIDIGERFGKNKEFGIRFNGVIRDGETGVDNQKQGRSLISLGMDYKLKNFSAKLDTYYIRDKFSGAAPFIVQARNSTLVTQRIIPSIPRASEGVNGIWGELENKGIMLRVDYRLNPYVNTYAGIGRALGNYEGFVGGATFVNPDALGNGRLSLSNSRMWITKTGYEAGISGQFDTGNVRHDIVFGGSILDLKTGVASNSSTFIDNMYNLSSYGWILPSLPNSPLKNQDYKMSSFAIADTMNFNDERVQVTVGVRKQFLDQNRYNTSTGVLLQKYDKGTTTPIYSIIAKPWDHNTSVYASYVEGLRPGQMVPTGLGYTNQGDILPPLYE